jgi:NAD-dependent SIR2 family protein deacetylase
MLGRRKKNVDSADTIISSTESVFILKGAGISAESEIPTIRDPEGL